MRVALAKAYRHFRRGRQLDSTSTGTPLACLCRVRAVGGNAWDEAPRHAYLEIVCTVGVPNDFGPRGSTHPSHLSLDGRCNATRKCCGRHIFSFLL
jgi:hypothetical protein